MDVTFFTHPSYDDHRMHGGHPECPERTRAILAHLRETGLLADLKQRKPDEVTEAALRRVHE
ncbi:MAG: histone deacetylase family protein, partial [Akkermansiaceae bacterium]|nr:histone deacetylase family protein [Akkermansiaceae bacterium]